jgi:hypothetical protein
LRGKPDAAAGAAASVVECAAIVQEVRYSIDHLIANQSAREDEPADSHRQKSHELQEVLPELVALPEQMVPSGTGSTGGDSRKGENLASIFGHLRRSIRKMKLLQDDLDQGFVGLFLGLFQQFQIQVSMLFARAI